MQETQVPSLDWEDPLEKGRTTHSSILAWRIPRTEESSGLQSMRLQRVRHNWVTKHASRDPRTDFMASECHAGGFPGGPAVKNLPDNAGSRGFKPWSRKIPHAVGQLSLCFTTAEPTHPRTHAPQHEKPLQWEVCDPQLKSSPYLPQGESACSNEDPWQPKMHK